MSRIYRYILVHDHGIAPCPADGLITLATCKPSIRRTASPGDWVLGFRPGSLERGMMLWGGRIERIVDHGQYELAHRGRPDALYRLETDGSYSRIDPDYHPTEKEKVRDLSGPVLIFDPAVSRYLHGKPMRLLDSLMHLAAAGRGHRISGVGDGDQEVLEQWLASLPCSFGTPGRRTRGSCN